MKSLYPEIDPFNTFLLETGTQHSVYVEQCGNPDGLPVIFLHGGPCSGCKPDHRRFFDAAIYHIILFDQRGCGRSLPFGEIEHNTTQDLLHDMERIRKQLGIKQWLLFGGSWGASLALLYAQQYTQHVSAMILRGVFLARERDMNWFIKEGVGNLFPAQWQRFMQCLPETERHNPIDAIWNMLHSEDELARFRIAKEWNAWGSQITLGWGFQPENYAEPGNQRMLQQVRMEIHYARHDYFIAENQIIQAAASLQNIDTVIIHGRNDMVCPLEAAYTLHQELFNAEYIVLANAGHIAKGESMVDALITATDKMAGIIADV